MAGDVSPQEAVTWLEQTLPVTTPQDNLCDHSTAVAYTPGHSWANSHSDAPNAIGHWRQILNQYPQDVHPYDTNPPAGALVFWQGGTDGHAAVSVGQGMIASTDAGGDYTWKIMPLSQPSKVWGNMQYLGWTNPDFPGSGIRGPNLATANTPSSSTTVGGMQIGGGDGINPFPNTSNGTATSAPGANLAPDGSTPDATFVRILKMLGGAGLIVIGLVFLLRRQLGSVAESGISAATGVTPAGGVVKTALRGRAQGQRREYQTGERLARQEYRTEQSDIGYSRRKEYQAQGQANYAERSGMIAKRQTDIENLSQANREKTLALKKVFSEVPLKDLMPAKRAKRKISKSDLTLG